jgi:hypothetical protein
MPGMELFRKDRYGQLAQKGEMDKRSLTDHLLIILLFSALCSLLFAVLFEWDRYQVILGPRGLAMSPPDKALLVWLLVAKSLVCLFPLLSISVVLNALGLRRISFVALSLCSAAMFYFGAFDLASVGFAGYHVSDYLPYIRDMLTHPEMVIWQWGGERLGMEALLLLGIFVTAVPACLMAVRGVTIRMLQRFGAQSSA